MPSETYDILRIKNEGIGVQRYGKPTVILEKYSESNFDELYEDIIEKIKEHNWDFLPTQMHTTAFASGEYSGYSACICIDTKGVAVFINIQDEEVAKRIK